MDERPRKPGVSFRIGSGNMEHGGLILFNLGVVVKGSVEY